MKLIKKFKNNAKLDSNLVLHKKDNLYEKLNEYDSKISQILSNKLFEHYGQTNYINQMTLKDAYKDKFSLISDNKNIACRIGDIVVINSAYAINGSFVNNSNDEIFNLPDVLKPKGNLIIWCKSNMSTDLIFGFVRSWKNAIVINTKGKEYTGELHILAMYSVS